MKRIWRAVALLLVVVPAHASEDKPVTVTPIMSTTVTATGQPIVFPQHDAEITVSSYDIAPGTKLPEHKHPLPRFGYVLSGTLRVTNNETGRTETYKPGDFVIEALGQWHQGENGGTDAVKLLVIDIGEKGHPNAIVKQP